MPRAIRFPATEEPLSAPTDEHLLSVKATAQRLGVSADTVKRLVRRGEIASVKLGKLRRVEPHAIRAYIVQHRVQRAG